MAMETRDLKTENNISSSSCFHPHNVWRVIFVHLHRSEELLFHKKEVN